MFVIHMTFASETKDEIVAIIKQAAGKHRNLWFREIKLPSLLSLKYVIWKKITAQFFRHVFLHKHSVQSHPHLHTCMGAVQSRDL